MALKLPSTSSSGCSTKLRARDLSALLQISEDSFFQCLAPDAKPLSQDRSSYFTIDTISPITRNPETFGQISVIHAITDLHALGAIPTDGCASFGLSSTLLSNCDGAALIASVQKKFDDEGIAFCNAHSYLSEEVQITLSIIGKNDRSFHSMEMGREYSLILTKELGASSGCHFGWLLGRKDMVSECENLMLLDHSKVLKYIQEFCLIGTTDISGFGILGHLAILSRSQKCELQVDLSTIPFYEKLDEVISGFPVNCSAQRNEEDFDEFCQWGREVSGHEKKKLFSSETSGPILCIVPQDSVSEFLQSLNSNGFLAARNVGHIRKTGSPSFQLV